MANPEEHRDQWISLIHYQLLTASRLAQAMTPLDNLALSTAHDAVESCLLLVINESGQKDFGQNEPFLQVFDRATESVTEHVARLKAHRPKMSQMNQARNGFKHKGNPTDTRNVGRQLDSCWAFVSELVDSAFGLNLSDASVISFVSSQRAQDSMRKAEAIAAGGDYSTALAWLRAAVHFVIADATGNRQWEWDHPLSSKNWGTSRAKRDDERGQVIDKRLDRIDRRMGMMAMGVSMKEFFFLVNNSPQTEVDRSDQVIVTPQPSDVKAGKATYDRCFKFVLEVGLSLESDEFDYGVREL